MFFLPHRDIDLTYLEQKVIAFELEIIAMWKKNSYENLPHTVFYDSMWYKF